MVSLCEGLFSNFSYRKRRNQVKSFVVTYYLPHTGDNVTIISNYKNLKKIVDSCIKYVSSIFTAGQLLHLDTKDFGHFSDFSSHS